MVEVKERPREAGEVAETTREAAEPLGEPSAKS